MSVVRVRFFLPLIPALLAAPAVYAAEAGDADSLDEVIVTGTLREQKLGEVPGSVTVLGEGTLRESGVQHFQDVLALVPNLNWAGGSSRPRYFQIRGIGEREQYEGAPNPSVGFLIDDIDFSGLGMPATLFDVKQIEVLRGPQGTQYGANALAGLIVVRSKEPEARAGYSVEATGGDYGTRSVGFTATGPVAALDSAWRVSVSKYQTDGFMKNSFLDRDDTNGRDELTARVKWHSGLGMDSALDFTYLHADLGNGYDAWSLDNSRTSLSDKPGEDSQLANGASLKLTSNLAGNRLIAIGSFVKSKLVNSYDSDWGNEASWSPYIYDYAARFERRRRTGSLELRLASPEGDFEWLVGAYALRLLEAGRDTASGHYVEPGAPDDGCETSQLELRYRASNVALFGQMNGLLAPRWHWAGGLRVEQRRARYNDDTIDGEPCDRELCEHDYMMGGHVSISRDLAAGTTAYTTLSRGYKAGGFNLGNDFPDEERRFKPEFLWNLEAGMKTGLAGRGHTELSFFYQWRYDQQVRSGKQLTPGDPNTYVFSTVNLPNGNAAGMELALQYEVTRGVQVGGSMGLLYTRTGPATVDDGDGNLVRVASRRNAHAPVFNGALNATWRASTGFMARVDLSGMGDFYFDVPTDHSQKSRGYALVNLKMGYEQPRWSAYAWVRNAFDKEYAVRGFYFENEPPDWEKKLYWQRGEPRQFGVTAELHF
jgi:outer membrane receptor protein involved in Fe transport